MTIQTTTSNLHRMHKHNSKILTSKILNKNPKIPMEFHSLNLTQALSLARHKESMQTRGNWSDHLQI